MPEVLFHIQWPDGETVECYSPSTVVREYFQPGMTMTVEEFTNRSSEALNRASDRVQAKFGFRCTSASGQLEIIQSRAKQFRADENVTIMDVG